jgi:hypothetical protein
MDRFKNLLHGIEQELSRGQNPQEPNMTMGSMVKNMDASCSHYGSIGTVEGIDTFPEPMGRVVTYKAVNEGKSWSIGQLIKKNAKYLAVATDFSNDDSRNTEYNNLSLMAEDMEPIEKDINEFLGMALTALKSIAIHAKHLYNSVDDPKVMENLTEAWVLAKIAVMQDQMGDIHDFVMFSESEENESSEKPHDPALVQSISKDELNQNHNEEREVNNPVETEIAKRPGLWDNIRKKKEREGKRYKPAKPGDKDRPDPDQWKKLTK